MVNNTFVLKQFSLEGAILVYREDDDVLAYTFVFVGALSNNYPFGTRKVPFLEIGIGDLEGHFDIHFDSISEWLGRFEKYVNLNGFKISGIRGIHDSFFALKSEVVNLCGDDLFTLSNLETLSNIKASSKETMMCDLVKIEIKPIA